MNKDNLKDYFNSKAKERDYWYKRNKFYHKEVARLFSRFILPDKSILEVGCATGNLLASLKPKRGLGVDFSSSMVEAARIKYPELEFLVADAEALDLKEKFDFVVLSDVCGLLDDIWNVLRRLRKVCHPQSLVVINSFNFLWYLSLRLAEILRLKMDSKHNNWLSLDDFKNLLYLAGFEVVEAGSDICFPIKVLPFLSKINLFLSRLPFFRQLGVSLYLVARPIEQGPDQQLSCSVIIPTRNEAGNIETCLKRMPKIGSFTELIFVDGSSTDGTIDEIKRMQEAYKDKFSIKLIHQAASSAEAASGKMLKAGKGDAVRKGFSAATGDILMILDSDLTVAPEDLPKFYFALAEGKTAFINGCRLVYPLEKQSMRFLNFLANKFFGLVFTWLLGQSIKDTLCGTKALLKKDYLKIEQNRSYFGDFDPFGDFDLLFGAARLKLKIADMPVRYWPRVYGEIKIERFKHGLLLLKMSAIGFKKLKLKI